MPNTKEKLNSLLYTAEELADKRCDSYPNCDNCPADNQRIDCMDWLKADCLLSLGVTVQEWISVKDRLPDKHDRYLCNVKAFSFPDLRYFAILKYDDGGFIEGKIYTDDVTHWMPLPQPPKGE